MGGGALVENSASVSFCSHVLGRQVDATGRFHSFCWTSLYYHSPLFDPLKNDEDLLFLAGCIRCVVLFQFAH